MLALNTDGRLFAMPVFIAGKFKLPHPWLAKEKFPCAGLAISSCAAYILYMAIPRPFVVPVGGVAVMIFPTLV